MANKQTYDFNKSLKDLNLTDLTAKIRGLRRDIARLKTELKKKEMGI